MKKNFLLITGAITLGAMLSGCSFVVPKKYKVVTKADYNFTLMERDIDFNKIFSMDSMFKSLPNTMSSYKYNPGGQSETRQYVFTLPIGEPAFEMPMSNYSDEKEFDTSNISSVMNSLVKIFGPVPPTGTGTISAVPDNTSDKFDSISYSRGIMKIYVESASAGATVDFKKNGESLFNGPKSFSSLDSSKEIEFTIDGNTVRKNMTACADVDLTGVTLYMNDITLEITGCSGFFYAEVMPDSVVKSASNVTVKNGYDVALGEETVKMDFGSSIKKFTIGEGYFYASAVQPESWNGVNINFAYSATGDLVMTSDENGKADLAGNSVDNNPAEFKLTPALKVTLENANIDLEKKLLLEFKTEIKMLSSVTIDASQINKPDSNEEKTVDTGVSFGEIMKSFGEEFCRNVKMDEMPVYIYAEKPEADEFSNISIAGDISVQGASEKVVKLLDGESIDMSAGRPDLGLDESGAVVTTDLSQVKNACSGDIAEVVSFSSNDPLKISYKLNIQGFDGSDEMTLENVAMEGKKTSIATYAYIVIPMTFKVIRDTDNNSDSFNFFGGKINEDGSKTDLLGRTEAPAESSEGSFADAIESFTLYVTSSKIPFKYRDEETKSIQLVMDFDGDEYEDGTAFNLSNGSYTMTREEIQTATHTFPYVPSIKLRFPAGKMSILDDMNLATHIDFEIKTDGTFTFGGSSENE